MRSGPHTAYTTARRSWRFRPEHAADAFVEFVLADGSPWRLSLVSLAVSGFGFALDDGRPAVASGTQIDGATIQVGGLKITGSARIVYVTTRSAVGKVCGAEFAPSTDADTRRMAFLLTRLERRNRRSG